MDLRIEISLPAKVQPSKPLKRSTSGPGKRSSKKAAKSVGSGTEQAAIGERDTTLFLFRALGKILYCKREKKTFVYELNIFS